jgi:hypothetical protein
MDLILTNPEKGTKSVESGQQGALPTAQTKLLEAKQLTGVCRGLFG